MLPCLQVGNKKRPNYLPMEVCKIVEGQPFTSRLNERQLTALREVTWQRPLQVENEIMKVVRNTSYDEHPLMKEFKIKISDNLVPVQARVLPSPMLQFHKTSEEKNCLPHVGQWSMKNKKALKGGVVNNWICINFMATYQCSISPFCHCIVQACKTLGMTFNPIPVLPFYEAVSKKVTAEMALRNQVRDALIKLDGEPLDLLIAVLPESRENPFYGDLKRICETELGIVSQCCCAKHVTKMKHNYFENLALKVNIKMGGVNFSVADAFSSRPPVFARPTIIIGADVSHPCSGNDLGPSIAAVVASQDWPLMTKYVGLVSAQAPRQELIEDLFKNWHDPVSGSMTGGMIKELLRSFYRATGVKPQQIIFYRDGVSEGMFSKVLQLELDAIHKACASLESYYKPTITFVVVQKRHNTKFFAYDHSDRSSVDDTGNILPGTVVDSKICHPTGFDFYLCSHAGIQGTSRPTHYHVLLDENGFTADTLQLLTNNLCYASAKSTRSISIVAPVRYAHLAARRGSCYVEPRDTESAGHGLPGGRALVKPLPALKENLKRVMFYC